MNLNWQLRLRLVYTLVVNQLKRWLCTRVNQPVEVGLHEPQLAVEVRGNQAFFCCFFKGIASSRHQKRDFNYFFVTNPCDKEVNANRALNIVKKCQ